MPCIVSVLGYSLILDKPCTGADQTDKSRINITFVHNSTVAQYTCNVGQVFNDNTTSRTAICLNGSWHVKMPHCKGNYFIIVYDNKVLFEMLVRVRAHVRGNRVYQIQKQLFYFLVSFCVMYRFFLAIHYTNTHLFPDTMM